MLGRWNHQRARLRPPESRHSQPARAPRAVPRAGATTPPGQACRGPGGSERSPCEARPVARRSGCGPASPARPAAPPRVRDSPAGRVGLRRPWVLHGFPEAPPCLVLGGEGGPPGRKPLLKWGPSPVVRGGPPRLQGAPRTGLPTGPGPHAARHFSSLRRADCWPLSVQGPCTPGPGRDCRPPAPLSETRGGTQAAGAPTPPSTRPAGGLGTHTESSRAL